MINIILRNSFAFRYLPKILSIVVQAMRNSDFHDSPLNSHEVTKYGLCHKKGAYFLSDRQ